MMICGKSVRSAMALLSPVVDPPPMATSPSAPSFSTTANAASVTSTGVCMTAVARTPAERVPKAAARRSASGFREGVASTKARCRPSRSTSSGRRTLVPWPKITRDGRVVQMNSIKLRSPSLTAAQAASSLMSSNEASGARQMLIELEQLDRISPTNPQTIGWRDGRTIKPIRRVIDVFKRPVGREHDAARTDHAHGSEQRLRAEIPRYRDVEVLVEVIGNRALAAMRARRLDPGISVVDAPEIEGDALAHVPDHDLQPRMLVEHARPHQPQRMHGCFLTEGPGRPDQPFGALIDAGVLRQGIARMQIERHVEPLDLRPERPILRQVIIEQRIRIGALREAVGEHTDKTQFLHTSD